MEKETSDDECCSHDEQIPGMLLAWCSLAIASLGGAVLLLVIGSVVAPYTLGKGAWDFSEGRTWSVLLEMVLGALCIVMVYFAAAEMDAAIRQYDDIIKEYDRQHGGDGSSGNNNGGSPRGGEGSGGTDTGAGPYRGKDGGGGLPPQEPPADPVNELLEDKVFTNSKDGGKLLNYESPTKGTQEALNDFYSLNPIRTETKPNGTLVGFLSDGRVINVHTATETSGNPPTLEIISSGVHTKIRH